MSQMKTVNLIDLLAKKLSETGVPFRADSWENNPPVNYGVVELAGQNNADWADGHMTDQAFTAEITLYVAGTSMKWGDRIQAVLEAMDAGYSLPRRQWLPDIKKSAWTWKASFLAPLEWEETAEV